MKSAKTLRSVGTVFIGALLTALPRLAEAQQSTSSCGADPESQAQVVGVTRHMLGSTDARDVQLRDRFGLSGIPPDSATLVTDPRICARAAQRINWLADEHRKDRVVYVVRIGDVWAVHDPTFHAGEYSPLVLFDSHWKVLATLLAM